jgi:hypothetical protein
MAHATTRVTLLPGPWRPRRVRAVWTADVVHARAERVVVLLRVYAKCIDGQDQLNKGRVDDVLNGYSQREPDTPSTGTDEDEPEQPDSTRPDRDMFVPVNREALGAAGPELTRKILYKYILTAWLSGHTK